MLFDLDVKAPRPQHGSGIHNTSLYIITENDDTIYSLIPGPHPFTCSTIIGEMHVVEMMFCHELLHLP